MVPDIEYRHTFVAVSCATTSSLLSASLELESAVGAAFRGVFRGVFAASAFLTGCLGAPVRMRP